MECSTELLKAITSEDTSRERSAMSRLTDKEWAAELQRASETLHRSASEAARQDDWAAAKRIHREAEAVDAQRRRLPE